MYALRNLRALTRITRAPSPFSQRGTAAAPSRGKKQKARGSGASGAKGEGIGLDVDLSPYREKMQRTIEAFQRDLSSIRSSGASPSMLDNVQVEAYGTMTSLQKLAQVTVRDARSLQVSVFDTAITAVVEKAIRGAGLNLNPALESSDAGRITVPVPKATRETRDLLQKVGLVDDGSCSLYCRPTAVLVMSPDALRSPALTPLCYVLLMVGLTNMP